MKIGKTLIALALIGMFPTVVAWSAQLTFTDEDGGSTHRGAVVSLTDAEETDEPAATFVGDWCTFAGGSCGDAKPESCCDVRTECCCNSCGGPGIGCCCGCTMLVESLAVDDITRQWVRNQSTLVSS